MPHWERACLLFLFMLKGFYLFPYTWRELRSPKFTLKRDAICALFCFPCFCYHTRACFCLFVFHICSPHDQISEVLFLYMPAPHRSLLEHKKTRSVKRFRIARLLAICRPCWRHVVPCPPCPRVQRVLPFPSFSELTPPHQRSTVNHKVPFSCHTHQIN